MAPKVAEKAVKAPASKAPAAKKVVKKATAGASKKKVKAVESYKIYIYKVLKQVDLSSPLAPLSLSCYSESSSRSGGLLRYYDIKKCQSCCILKIQMVAGSP